jgi:hypothetical protein
MADRPDNSKGAIDKLPTDKAPSVYERNPLWDDSYGYSSFDKPGDAATDRTKLAPSINPPPSANAENQARQIDVPRTGEGETEGEIMVTPAPYPPRK